MCRVSSTVNNSNSRAMAKNGEQALKKFHIVRNEEGVQVSVSDYEGSKPLELRTDLVNHSPTGFEYGYGGSGQAQLALAMLAEVLGDEEGKKYYQYYKSYIVANWTSRDFEISEDEIKSWLKAKFPEDFKK